jgi:hypothetical protein
MSDINGIVIVTALPPNNEDYPQILQKRAEAERKLEETRAREAAEAETLRRAADQGHAINTVV